MSDTYGLFIPPEVLTQAGLNLPARLVLAEILNLHKSSGQVWASDQHFSDRLCTPLRTIGTAIKDLVDEGFIVRVTKQNALPKRTLTPTSLCYPPPADSARGTPEPAPAAEPPADLARATPDQLPNQQEPLAKSAEDLLPDQQEPLAKSAGINNQLKEKGNKPSSSKKKKGEKSTNSLFPEVEKPEGEAPTSEPVLEPWEVWLAENAPRVQKLKTPLTGKHWHNLVADFGEATVKSVLLGMENKADLLRKYTSANLTAREWCGRRPGRPPQPPKTAPPVLEPELNHEVVNERDTQQRAAAADARRAARQRSTEV